jgi:signal transduction histidine kinase
VYSEASKRSASDIKESRLAASLAHEINNPLDSVLNLLYLLGKEAILTEKGRQYLMLAEGEVHRVSQIAHAELDRFRDSAPPQDTYVPRFEHHTGNALCMISDIRAWLLKLLNM